MSKGFTEIKPPKFRIGRYVLNEYELRNLLLDVCKGDKESFIGCTVIDDLGNKAKIKWYGLDSRLHGLDIMTKIAFEYMSVKNKKVGDLDGITETYL
jgi:hypothetical protein